MGVTDDIADAIVALCVEGKMKEFSNTVIREDYIPGYAEDLVCEITDKLREKGIEVS